MARRLRALARNRSASRCQRWYVCHRLEEGSRRVWKPASRATRQPSNHRRMKTECLLLAKIGELRSVRSVFEIQSAVRARCGSEPGVHVVDERCGGDREARQLPWRGGDEAGAESLRVRLRHQRALQQLREELLGGQLLEGAAAKGRGEKTCQWGQATA
eukprot:2265454-Pleurochrysis_carterae.AAC.1